MYDITLEDAQEMLLIDKAQLDDAIIKQPQFYYQVSKQVVSYQEIKDSKKNDLDKLESETSSYYRDSLTRKDKKFTESALKEMVQIDDDFIEAREEYLQARRDLEDWVSMKEAFNQRGFMLRELARLWTSNYYSDPTVAASGDVSKVANRHNREILNSTRKSRASKKRRA